MNDNHTLLSYVARHHTLDLEDVATNALYFILSRSDSARSALSDFLGDERGPLPVVEAKPWAAVAHGAEPDMVCVDENNNRVAFIEAKFWAGLTAHQPVTYWKDLPDDSPAVLLFLAPDSRIDEGSLWTELEDRLRGKGHELGPAVRNKGLVTAFEKVGQRRLMLASWHLLLDRMAQRTRKDNDDQASFEIAQLRGLANSAIEGHRPQRDENLKLWIGEALKRLKQSGWANTDRLSVGQGNDFYGRYLRLAGASAWLGIDYRAVKQMPDKPLWLTFGRYSDARVSLEAVRSSLDSRAEYELEWYPGQLCVPIVLPVAADHQTTLKAIITELERIAELIDPDGPTYQKNTPVAGGNRPMTRTEPKRSIENPVRGRASIKVVCWNIATMHDPWRELVEMDADVALLQEVGTVPEDVRDQVELSPHEPWLKYDPTTGNQHYDRWPMVVGLSNRVRVEWFRQIGPTGVDLNNPHDMVVSGIGMVEVARVVPTSDEEPFIAASMYARWLGPHPTTEGSGGGYPDVSAHSIISDLSAFIGSTDPRTHRILAAGDLNISFWSADPFDHRAQTVMDRFQALGLDYMGPQHPNGRQAKPIPEHLNERSLDVPTYYSKSSNTPAGAYVQIDHVFASRGFHEEIRTRALNEVEDWGPSDHCRIAIDVG